MECLLALERWFWISSLAHLKINRSRGIIVFSFSPQLQLFSPLSNRAFMKVDINIPLLIWLVFKKLIFLPLPISHFLKSFFKSVFTLHFQNQKWHQQTHFPLLSTLLTSLGVQSTFLSHGVGREML